ncbi:MAG: thiamine phosphate synthase [Candidatus Omnitrophica bacterium]|nr:thiamine phosphate synthase [Candidatus Omnitrophota bacterium]
MELGNILSLICVRGGVTFIVNDDPEIAKEVNADGVHLGQEDLKKWPLHKVRSILEKNKIIGISTHSLRQFTEAEASDCDYIAFGPIFGTKTKDYSIGTCDIEKIAASSKKPVVFIGGIDLENVGAVTRRGGKNIAVIRSIMHADDVEETVKAFKAKLNGNSRS